MVVVTRLFVKIRGVANLKGMILLSVNSISINLIKTKQNTPISLELIFLEQVNTTGKLYISRNLKKAWAWVSGHEEKHLEHLEKHLKGLLLSSGKGSHSSKTAHILTTESPKMASEGFCGLENSGYSIFAFCMLHITHTLFLYNCGMDNKAVTS